MTELGLFIATFNLKETKPRFPGSTIMNQSQIENLKSQIHE